MFSTLTSLLPSPKLSWLSLGQAAFALCTLPSPRDTSQSADDLVAKVSLKTSLKGVFAEVSKDENKFLISYSSDNKTRKCPFPAGDVTCKYSGPESSESPKDKLRVEGGRVGGFLEK